MEKYRVTVDRRVDGQTTESNILQETTHHIGVSFDDCEPGGETSGQCFIAGKYSMVEIDVYAQVCADVLIRLTKNRSNAPEIWHRFVKTIMDRVEEFADKCVKEKEAEIRERMRKQGRKDEEIDEALDIVAKFAKVLAESEREGGDAT
jgi:hypothetical protein